MPPPARTQENTPVLPPMIWTVTQQKPRLKSKVWLSFVFLFSPQTFDIRWSSADMNMKVCLLGFLWLQSEVGSEFLFMFSALSQKNNNAETINQPTNKPNQNKQQQKPKQKTKTHTKTWQTKNKHQTEQSKWTIHFCNVAFRRCYWELWYTFQSQ